MKFSVFLHYFSFPLYSLRHSAPLCAYVNPSALKTPIEKNALGAKQNRQ